MELYRTEEEQVQAIKQWWRRNRTAVISGIVLGLGGIFIWQEWQGYRFNESLQASEKYQKMITAARAEKSEDIQKYAEQLQRHDITAYAGFALLMQAKKAAEDGDLPLAREHLENFLATNPQAQLEHVARLRLGRILLALGKLDEARTVINKRRKNAFSSSYKELEADILLQEGRVDDARIAYQEALDEAENNEQQNNELLSIKLEDIGNRSMQ